MNINIIEWDKTSEINKSNNELGYDSNINCAVQILKLINEKFINTFSSSILLRHKSAVSQVILAAWGL